MEWYDLIEKAYTNSCVCDDDCGSHGVGCDDAETCDDYCSAD